jgi:hypothetical protein
MGRPKGQTKEKVTVIVEHSKCPKCGSVERSNYNNIITYDIVGIHNGIEYVRVVFRSTKCLSCGQIRKDKSFVTKDGSEI